MARIRQQAQSQARAEYGPQKAQVRRSVRGQTRSLRSEQPALEEGIARAEQQLRHSGLTGRDLTIALGELARRNVDVASETALGISQVHRTGHEELTDLSQAQGAASRSALASLQQAALEHRQKVADEIAAEQRGTATDLRTAEAEKKLGLGDYFHANGLTPTQQRDAKQSHDNAAFYALKLIQAAKGGVKDEKTGKYVIPPHPHNWTDETWSQLIEQVAAKKGVNDVHDAARAVGAIRAHYQPNGQPQTTGSVLNSLRELAAPAAALAPKSLQPVAKFGSALLGY
jgi:hypothetical protein